MLIAKIAALLVLALIFIQDMMSRSVYWIAFPVLITSLVIVKSFYFSITEMVGSAGINIGFLAMQLLLLSAWFSLKEGKLVNITSALIGWGDILLLICLACYLSVLNFLMFYLGSLLLVLIFWVSGRAVANSNGYKHIPLAGYQAVLFLFLITADWLAAGFDLLNDEWLLKLINT